MTEALVLSRLRRFLLAVSALLFVGTLCELLLIGHSEDAVQLIPFALCGVGLTSVLSGLFRPRRGVLLFLRACMALVALGSLYGVYEHVTNNLALQREVDPTGDALMAAIGGANPLLAPGVLALAAMLALAATYYHPALLKGHAEESGP